MQQREQDPLSVQGTNDDSILSKRHIYFVNSKVFCLRFTNISRSASRLKYFDDEFLRVFATKPPRRSPLINRGYYIRFFSLTNYYCTRLLSTLTYFYLFIRCKIIRDALAHFLSSVDVGSKKQILSLGAGYVNQPITELD